MSWLIMDYYIFWDSWFYADSMLILYYFLSNSFITTFHKPVLKIIAFTGISGDVYYLIIILFVQ